MWDPTVSQRFLHNPGSSEESLCRWRSVVTKHDVEGSGEVVGERAAVAFIHERQQEGEQQQSEEEEPQRKSQSTDPLQQSRLLHHREESSMHRHTLHVIQKYNC